MTELATNSIHVCREELGQWITKPYQTFDAMLAVSYTQQGTPRPLTPPNANHLSSRAMFWSLSGVIQLQACLRAFGLKSLFGQYNW